MAPKKATPNKKRPIETYEHKDKNRANNPPVGLVTPDTDPDLAKKKTYEYDPHLDPQLQWAGKAEHTSFDIPTVSLHVHERISPRSIIEAVRKRNGGHGPEQLSLFDSLEENPPLREAIEFYKHAHNWSNRMVAGDSLLVMNSLLEKEGMAGKVQMVYLDPPYGIKYGSNFQPFVNKRDVKDGNDDDLTGEPEQIRAFRDTWELGIHSYLTYLRDRLLLARQLLTESGSVFVQIGDENVHHVRELMDEVFGAGNFVALIPFKKTSALGSGGLDTINDYLLFYSRSRAHLKYRQLYVERPEDKSSFTWVETEDGTERRLSGDEKAGSSNIQGRLFRSDNLTSQSGGDSTAFTYEFQGKSYTPSSSAFWKTTHAGLDTLSKAGRLIGVGNTLAYKRGSSQESVHENGELNMLSLSVTT